MTNPPIREGPPDAATTVIVLDAPDDLPLPPKPQRDGLEMRGFVGTPYARAVAGPVIRVRVTVDGVLLPLPHDNPAALRDFVESLYLLYGWPAVLGVAEELAMMRKLVEKPDEVARELLRPGRAGLMQDPIGRARYEELRRRLDPADALQVRAWDEAFEPAFRELRLSVLAKMRGFERMALETAKATLDKSQATLVAQVKRYYRWDNDDRASFALNTLNTGPWVWDKEDTRDLRARLVKLLPATRAIQEAETIKSTWKAAHLVGSRRTPLSFAETKQLERLDAQIEAEKAAYGKAVVIEAAEHPVLFRFDPETTAAAATANDGHLGGLVWSPLKAAWDAQLGMREALWKNQVAKRTKDARIQAGELPEALIGHDAKDSVWAYPRLLERTYVRLSPDEFRFLEVAIPNTQAALAGMERTEALLSTVAGIGLAGLQLGVIAVCPPAGIALDVAMSASDIFQAAQEREAQSNAALCVLDPREAFAETEPSVLPLVFAVAGAALVVV